MRVDMHVDMCIDVCQERATHGWNALVEMVLMSTALSIALPLDVPQNSWGSRKNDFLHLKKPL